MCLPFENPLAHLVCAQFLGLLAGLDAAPGSPDIVWKWQETYITSWECRHVEGNAWHHLQVTHLHHFRAKSGAPGRALTLPGCPSDLVWAFWAWGLDQGLPSLWNESRTRLSWSVLIPSSHHPTLHSDLLAATLQHVVEDSGIHFKGIQSVHTRRGRWVDLQDLMASMYELNEHCRMYFPGTANRKGPFSSGPCISGEIIISASFLAEEHKLPGKPRRSSWTQFENHWFKILIKTLN